MEELAADPHRIVAAAEKVGPLVVERSCTQMGTQPSHGDSTARVALARGMRIQLRLSAVSAAPLRSEGLRVALTARRVQKMAGKA